MAEQLEIGRGVHPIDQIATQVGVIMVDDDHRDVFHIQTQGVSEQKDQ